MSVSSINAQVCYHKLTFSLVAIKSKPLSSIINVPSQTSHVTGLTFVPGLPSVQSSLLSTPTLGHHNVTPQSSPAMTHASVMQSPGRAAQKYVPKGSPPKPGIEKLRGKTRSVLYLLCSTVDVGQCMSCVFSFVAHLRMTQLLTLDSTPPKSDIAAFLYARSTDANIPWVCSVLSYSLTVVLTMQLGIQTPSPTDIAVDHRGRSGFMSILQFISAR